MYTKTQLLQAIAEVPAEFSLAELEEILSRPRPAPTLAPPARPANLTPEQAAEWDYYTSPEAMALASRFPVPADVERLHGIIKLSEEDKHKSYDELRWEAMKEKYSL